MRYQWIDAHPPMWPHIPRRELVTPGRPDAVWGVVRGVVERTGGAGEPPWNVIMPPMECTAFETAEEAERAVERALGLDRREAGDD